MSESEFEFGDATVSSEHDAADVLALLDAQPCPRADCTGVLHQGTYKDTDAIVCETCDVPAARIWGDGS
jgi:hypothetical protein